MYKNKKEILSIMMVSILTINSLFAQTTVKSDSISKSNSSFVFYIGGGLAGYTGSISPLPGILQGDVAKSNMATTFRVMWHPGYRLRLGIESGFTNFYSYKVKNGSTEGKVRLGAVPVMILWSMPLSKRMEIFGGLGSYFLTTHLNYNGELKSSSVILGSNLALTYTQPLSKTLGLAAEVKLYNAFETKDDLISLQLLLVWDIFKK